MDIHRIHQPATLIAIPVKDEAETIGPCLLALAAQAGRPLDGAVLCLNNCTDGSQDAVRSVAAALSFPVHLVSVELAAETACAGVARRIAMDHAAERAGPQGIVLTTDADGRVAPGWLAANLAALEAGADAVAGQAEIEPVGARRIPAHLRAIDAQECAYAAMLDEIRWRLDPDPADPWPRHDEHSGASIAVTVRAYRLAGGMPRAAVGEDRAFFDALRRVDARIRHDPGARVVVSARTVGRAKGGMADTMRSRIECLHEFLDDRLEPVSDAARRAGLRARLRTAWHAPGVAGTEIGALAAALEITVQAAEALMIERYFGAAWASAEAASLVLRRQLVPLADVPRQTAMARLMLDALRAEDTIIPAADRADTSLRVVAE